METCVCILIAAEKRLQLLKLGKEIQQLEEQKKAADLRVAENEMMRRLDKTPILTKTSNLTIGAQGKTCKTLEICPYAPAAEGSHSSLELQSPFPLIPTLERFPSPPAIHLVLDRETPAEEEPSSCPELQHPSPVTQISTPPPLAPLTSKTLGEASPKTGDPLNPPMQFLDPLSLTLGYLPNPTLTPPSQNESLLLHPKPTGPPLPPSLLPPSQSLKSGSPQPKLHGYFDASSNFQEETLLCEISITRLDSRSLESNQSATQSPGPPGSCPPPSGSTGRSRPGPTASTASRRLVNVAEKRKINNPARKIKEKLPPAPPSPPPPGTPCPSRSPGASPLPPGPPGTEPPSPTARPGAKRLTMEPEKQKNENYIRTASSHHTSPPTAALPPPPPPPQSPAQGQASLPPWRSRRTTPGKSAPGLGRQSAKQLPASDCMNAAYRIVRSCKGKDDFETKIEVKHENVQTRTSLAEARWSNLSRKNDIKPKYKQAGAELSETLIRDQVMGGGAKRLHQL